MRFPSFILPKKVIVVGPLNKKLGEDYSKRAGVPFYDTIRCLDIPNNLSEKFVHEEYLLLKQLIKDNDGYVISCSKKLSEFLPARELLRNSQIVCVENGKALSKSQFLLCIRENTKN
jgi:hypothetical protein